MHSNRNPDPTITVRLGASAWSNALDHLEPPNPAAVALRSFEPHPGFARGTVTMTAAAPASEWSAALAALEEAMDASALTDRRALHELYRPAAIIAQALGTTIASVRSRLSVLASELPHAAGQRAATHAYYMAAETSTLQAVALRALEDAEVVPDIWFSARAALLRGGMNRALRHTGVPGFAFLIPPMPLHLIPPPVDLGGGYDHLTAALAATPHLDRLELVANKMGGPAAAARAWLFDFLATCLIGRDSEPTAAAEARALVHRAWSEVVVPRATRS